jgi:hypothetical protein
MRVFLFLFFISTQALSGVIDKSSTIFIPSSMEKLISVPQSYSLFWWNFLVLKETDDRNKICKILKASPHVAKVECHTHPSEFKDILNDWSMDYPLRSEKPSKNGLIEQFNKAMLQTSLISGDSKLFTLFRADPFETWKDFKKRAEEKLRLKISREDGFFWDRTTKRIIIPIQFNFPPNISTKTHDISKALGFTPQLIGPHGSSLENEIQIKTDLKVVEKSGLLVLILFLGTIFILKRWHLALLFPVVFVGVGLSTLLTIIVFGSIHGLTLSLGTAIVGLAIDYGLQGAFNIHEKGIWKSSLCGLFTTLTALFVLMTSSVPLLRQMMFFASFGMIFSFILYYILLTKKPRIFEVAPLKIIAPPRVWKFIVSLALLFSTIAGLIFIRPELDMRQFNFQSKENKETSEWLYRSNNLPVPIFEIHNNTESFSASHERLKWAKENNISVETWASYLPSLEDQKKHLETWNSSWTDELSQNHKKLFSPFLENYTKTPHSIKKSYVSHLVSADDHWITLWLPKSISEEKAIRAQFTDATSLREVLAHFPKILVNELAWMIPLSILIAWIIHFVYYRNIILSVVALMPFFTGVGLLTLATFVFDLQFSFISVIGLIIIFGLSLDYGIFATDAVLLKVEEKTHGIWTAVFCASFTTIGGFVPLLFCEHPVLKHLGQTLFFGSLGTFLGSYWGIPSLLEKVKIK